MSGSRNGSGKFANPLTPHEASSHGAPPPDFSNLSDTEARIVSLVESRVKGHDSGLMKKVLTGVLVAVAGGAILGAGTQAIITWKNDDKQDQKIERVDRDIQKHTHNGQQKQIRDIQQDVAVLKTDVKNQGDKLEDVKDDTEKTRESLNRIERRLGLPGDRD